MCICKSPGEEWKIRKDAPREFVEGKETLAEPRGPQMTRMTLVITLHNVPYQNMPGPNTMQLYLTQCARA